ncbi:hypothetical protein [Treponema sp.]|uniref:hypothetical protein n=1 Tax=Treponema sp. TaxID=166 RepID=UPI00298E9CA5|nr:hypothetical protein [Treponema sp.]MCQ2240592.1 hypothetical protein [Treponema sp.]
MAEFVDGNPIEDMDPAEENLVFHYEKGSFRKREDLYTRNMATGRVKMSPGFFKALVSTKGNKLVFFTMLICIGVTVFLGIFRRTESDSIAGIQCTASAFSFDGKVYATLEMEKTSKKTDDLPVAIDVLLECINDENAVADKYSETYSYVGEGKQFVRAVFSDYDLKKLKVVVKNGDKEKNLTAGITQR